MVLQIWKDLKKLQVQPVYLLQGTETYLLQETVKKILAAVLHEEEKEFNYSVYDMEETPIETAMEDAETLPFMGEKRVVLLKNPYFLTGERKKEKIEHKVETLEAYLKEPAPFTVLILLAPYEKLDERKKITKLLKKQAEAVEVHALSEKELFSWTASLAEAENRKISREAAERLAMLTNSNLMIMNQEINKLCMYTAESEEITAETVDLLTARSLEQNIFDLIENTVSKNIPRAMAMLYDLLKTNEEPIKILSLMVNQFRLILQVKQLSKTGYGQPQIASVLKVHPFRVKLAQKQASLFAEEELSKILKRLAEADYEMKTGKMEKQLILELFLLKLSQRPSA
ncbi:DNA polymerase III subunit delta [Metabacillus sp. GX 13764]|uniref:DNA polymerase III subunit delta n=1 Tax=Metabacillus kandeliae TaxID=2900151 RepID=UPI001E618581|nr:DNA polymerase III subunit delta [Metabacillus kandeliae]MCD7033033.1 DNA polymerase III subunit delta [Metabacillus kandeliae]